MSRFNEDISLLNPTKFVNDENLNKPLNELEENINFILNFLNGNKALLAGVYGNLWDYNKDGQKILVNGGKFDSFRKCNQWNALNEMMVQNDEQIYFDFVNNHCVFDGRSEKVENREVWLEREIWIPEPLRGQSLVFAMKATSSTEKESWTEESSIYETIAVQIIGGDQDVNEFRTVGLWQNQDYYSNESYGSRITTVFVPFSTKKETKSVRIKLLRTLNEGFFRIENIFVGGATLPYDNETESYKIEELDINELYDFHNNKTKINSTTILGHKVPQNINTIVGNDIITYDHVQTWLKDILEEVVSETYPECVTTGTTGTTGTATTGTTGTTGIPDFCDFEGTIELYESDKIYLIEHPEVEDSSPTITLELPSESSVFIQIAVCNVSLSNFQVILSDFPPEPEYKVHWRVRNPAGNIAKNILDKIVIEKVEEEIPEPTILPEIFNYETIN